VSENVELVRHIHAVWNRGEDLREVGLISEDIEYVNPDDAMEPGTRHGREGWGRAMRMVFESYDEARIDVERILEVPPDRVLVLATFSVYGRGSRVPVEGPQGYLWTLRDGQAVRFQWFTGHEPALAAAGLDG
jgi:ketosteroid isomerase-like protein